VIEAHNAAHTPPEKEQAPEFPERLFDEVAGG